MATKTMCKLPVIDLSNLKRGTVEWESVRTQVRNAFEEYGCFEAFCDDITETLRSSVFNGVQQLFNLPSETKERNKSDMPARGYAKINLYESMGIGDVLNRETIESFTNCLWPQGNPTVCENVISFSDKICELEQNVRRMVVESYELEKHVDEFMNSSIYLLRFQKYDAPHNSKGEIGLKPHTDTDFVTLLFPSEVAGLEILTKDGQWMDANPSPNHFIVFAGDTFHAWTNGRLHSVEHRVVMKGDVARYSIGLFSIPKIGYTIKAPEEMVDEEHPVLFKPYEHSKFMEYYFSRTELGNPYAVLKEFCGA